MNEVLESIKQDETSSGTNDKESAISKKKFSKLSFSESVDEESIEEITTTGDVAGYSTPFAFSSKEDEKKKKKRLTRSTGYSVVKEALNDKDLKQINKLIRDVVGDILRDIWLKRNAWK